MSLDLSYLYRDEYLDLENFGNSLSRFIWWDLEYWRDGKIIKIPAFKVVELGDLNDLKYYEKYFSKHVDRIYDFCEFLNEQLRAIANFDDTESYKEIAQDYWDNMDDEEREEYDDDFNNYWEEYSSSDSFYEMVGEDQRMQLDSFTDEFKEEFRIIDQELGRNSYFDSYDNLVVDIAEKFEEAVDDIKEAVEEFKESMYDLTDERKTKIFNEVFR